MTKFIIVILTLCCMPTLSAQISLADLLKGKVGNSTLLKDTSSEAVKPELSVIKQQYRLEQKGEYFGKNNKSYFGETYSLAVKVPGYLMILDDVVEPWKYDADYNRINASGKYTPKIFWTYQCAVSDSLYNPIDLEIGTEYVTPVNEFKSLYRHEDAKGDIGLSIDTTPGEKAGNLIMAYQNVNDKDSVISLDLRSSNYSFNANPDSLLINISPESPDKVIGGVFIVPKIERGGRVQYLVAGIVVRKDAYNWMLQMLTSGEEHGENALTKSEAVDQKKRKTKSQKR